MQTSGSSFPLAVVPSKWWQKSPANISQEAQLPSARCVIRDYGLRAGRLEDPPDIHTAFAYLSHVAQTPYHTQAV